MNAEAVISSLKDDYGITNPAELIDALAKMKRLNIGVFVNKLEKKRGSRDE